MKRRYSACSLLPYTFLTWPFSNSTPIFSSNGFSKPTAHCGIEDAVDRHVRGVIAADHLQLVEVRAVRRQVVHVAAVLVGDVVAAPAVVLLHDGAHRLGEVHHDVGAALVGEAQVEIAGVRIGARRGADDLAEEIDREARLRRVEQVEVAEERDLDPALALLAAQVDAERIDHRGEPGRDDEGRAFDQRLGFLRHFHQPRRGAHVGREGRAARLCDAVDRLQHARVDQRIVQHDDMVARLDRQDLVEIVGALRVGEDIGLRDTRPASAGRAWSST